MPGLLIGIILVLATRFPMFFPILLLAVIAISTFFSFAASWALLIIMEAVHGNNFSWETFDRLASFMSLSIFGFFLLGFMAQVLIVLTDLEKDRTRDRVIVLCELLFSMVVIFAVLHYYVDVFTEGAYHGLEAKQAFVVDDFGTAIGNILSVPTAKSAVDFLYFSTVVFSTVGFGEMHPLGVVAKLLTVSQIIFGFSVVIVGLGRAFSEKS